jgi:hypothetical protein
MARDDQFLFIHSRSRKQSASPNSPPRAKGAAPASTQRQRDELDDSKDHIRFRLDLDRDYSTWFEFAWDIDGKTLDRCNDMSWWNPEWFVAVDQVGDAWIAEVAIPLTSLLPDPAIETVNASRTTSGSVSPADVSGNNRDRDIEVIDWGERTWGISIVREAPSSPLQSNPICESNRWSRDRWILASPGRERSSQPEPPTHLANPAPAFLGTKR